jgi:hypothetical protein
LSSTGRTRRRLSDARDAATRPSYVLISLPVTNDARPFTILPPSVPSFWFNLIEILPSRPGSLQNVALSSLATLSLSSSPPSNNSHHHIHQKSKSQSAIAIQRPDAVTAAQADTSGSSDDLESSTSLLTHSSLGTSGGVTKNGKKRGTIFTCESCSKVAVFVP